jgi:ferric-dicitrate binding protein FerR (iron transport regulator)
MMENIKLQPEWSKSRDEIWSEHFEKLTQTSQNKVSRSPFRILFAAAAALLLLLVLPGLYVKSVVAERGERMEFILPDGSSVTLNSESEIFYKPIYWLFRRELRLKGEALFEVTKGKAFSVKTISGTITVLGTSFNVYSREQDLTVTCYSGKVAVNTSHNKVVLEKNNRFEVSKGVVSEYVSESLLKENSWAGNRFYFTSADIIRVFEEIERQYNIDIKYEGPEGLRYTGNFEKPESAAQVIEVVTAPFNMIVQKNDNQFTITAKIE